MQASPDPPAFDRLGARAVGGRIVHLTWPIRLLVPPLLLGSLSKRALGFAFIRGATNVAFGIALLALAVLVGMVMAPPLGWAAYVLSGWLVGTTGSMLVLNGATQGFVFIRPFCARCELAAIIVRHETLHLAGLARESDVWGALRHQFGSDATRFKAPATICGHCPIPVRLAAAREQVRG